MSFNNRSDALIELLEEFSQGGHEYVLVGGYAVSAFNARSTDLNIVVAPHSKVDFVEYFEERGSPQPRTPAKCDSPIRRPIWMPTKSPRGSTIPAPTIRKLLNHLPTTNRASANSAQGN